MMEVPDIGVDELRARLDGQGGQELVLLDVREPVEWQICRLPNAVLAPLSELAQHGTAALPDFLTPAARIVVYCHHGVRSAQVASWLLRQGYHDVVNLAGGIDAWSARIDPSIPRYY